MFSIVDIFLVALKSWYMKLTGIFLGMPKCVGNVLGLKGCGRAPVAGKRQSNPTPRSGVRPYYIFVCTISTDKNNRIFVYNKCSNITQFRMYLYYKNL